MPLPSPVYPSGPYRFIDCEFFTISCRTGLKLPEAVVVAPSKPAGEGATMHGAWRSPVVLQLCEYVRACAGGRTASARGGGCRAHPA